MRAHAVAKPLASSLRARRRESPASMPCDVADRPKWLSRRRLPFLKDLLAATAQSRHDALLVLARSPMAPKSLHSLRSLAIGFVAAGLIAGSFQLVTTRSLNFRFLSHPEPTTAVAAVPMLVLAAPFVIARKSAPEPAARASACRVHRAWRRCSSASGA